MSAARSFADARAAWVDRVADSMPGRAGGGLEGLLAIIGFGERSGFHRESRIVFSCAINRGDVS